MAAKFGLFVDEDHSKLPTLYWLPKLHKRPFKSRFISIIVWDSSRRPCVRPSTLSDMNISETSWIIIIKFHQKHYWGGGLIALGFG